MIKSKDATLSTKQLYIYSENHDEELQLCFIHGRIFPKRIIGVLILRIGINRKQTFAHTHVNLDHILILIIKFFHLLTLLALATNIFILCINNTGAWLKIFSEICLVGP